MPEWLGNIGWILIVIFFFGFSVFIHEFGHLLAAMWRGFHIEKFSIGFGHRIWGFKKNGIEFIVGWLPFGGYVALPQLEPNDEPISQDGKLLPVPKAIDRIIVAVAGPVFNLLFAFVLATILWKTGKPASAPLESLVVEDVPMASVDYKAGLRNGDNILSINGKKLKNNEMFIKEHIFSSEVEFIVERDGNKIQIGPFEPTPNPNLDGLRVPSFGVKETLDPIRAFVDAVPEYNEKKVKFAAFDAGMLPGDEIVAVDGKQIKYRRDVTKAIIAKKGAPLVFTVLRQGETLDIEIKPVKIEQDIMGIAFAKNSFPEVYAAKQNAYLAGIRRQDKVLLVNGRDCPTLEELKKVLAANKGKIVAVEVERNGERLKFAVMNKYETYQIGIHFARYKVFRTPYQQFYDVISETFKTLKGLVSGAVPPAGLSGPIGIGQGIYMTFKHGGLTAGLAFVFMINISLAIFNLLPIPVLDGGHIFLAVGELVSRRKVPAKVLIPIQTVFVLFFITLMFYVTTKDIGRMDDLIKWVEHTPGVNLHRQV